MTESMVLRGGNVFGRPGTWDVGLRDGKVAQVAKHCLGDWDVSVDVSGSLVAPSFVEPHIHLDKALLSAYSNDSGTLAEAINLQKAAKAHYTVEDVRSRAIQAIKQYICNGTLSFRVHVDVDVDIEMVGLQGLLAAKQQLGDLVDMQVVAFPHYATLRFPRSQELLLKAMQCGADILGAFPDVELCRQNGERHLDDMVEIARDRCWPLDVHIDEGEESRYLEHLACRCIESGLTGSVVASHACALGSYDKLYRDRVIGLLKASKIGVVVCPETNLLMGGRGDIRAARRGLAPVKALIEAGVVVAFGQDNMQDMFCPFGHGDALEVALVGSLAAHMTSNREMDDVFRMCTVYPRSLLGLPDNSVSVGSDADIVVLGGRNASDCLSGRVERNWVIRHGKAVYGSHLDASQVDRRLASAVN